MLVETETNPPRSQKDAEKILNLSASEVKILIRNKKLKVIRIGGKNYISNYSIKSLQIEYEKKREEISKNDVRNAVLKFIEEKILKFSIIIKSRQKAEKMEKILLELSNYKNVNIDIKHRLSEQSFEILHQNKLITFGEMREVVKTVYLNRMKRRTF